MPSRRTVIGSVLATAVVATAGCLSSWTSSYPTVAEINVGNYADTPREFELTLSEPNGTVVFERAETIPGYIDQETPPGVFYEPEVGTDRRLQFQISVTGKEAERLDTADITGASVIGLTVDIDHPSKSGVTIGVLTDLDA